MKFDSPPKKIAAVTLSIIGIAIAAVLVHRYQNRPPDERLQHHRGAGRALAREVVRLLEDRDKKRLIIITAKSPDTILAAQMATFHEVLKQHPSIEIRETEELSSDGDKRISAGQGLSARKFVRIVNDTRKADAMVSFVGLPDPEDDEMKLLTNRVPRLVAETVNPERAEKFFERNMLRLAIAPRFQFPSPVKNPKTEQEWFDKYFQVMKPPKTAAPGNAGTQ